MTKKITISELELIGLIEKSIQNKLEEQEEDMLVGDLEVMDEPMMGFEDEMEDEEDEDEELEELLSPEEILELTAEQIAQLQDRTQYMEELNADVLEFIQYLMNDLRKTEGIDLIKSSQKLRVLETRSGRDMFWLKSRRL